MAENSSIKLAKKDRLLGFKISYPYYSNQFIPLITSADLKDRIRLQGMFDKEFSGGAICHINVDTPITDVDTIEKLIRTCARKGVIYFALNYVLQKCTNNHMTVGNKEICQVCGEKITDSYTRVVGFLTNTKSWSRTRRDHDFPHRQFYSEKESPIEHKKNNVVEIKQEDIQVANVGK